MRAKAPEYPARRETAVGDPDGPPRLILAPSRLGLGAFREALQQHVAPDHRVVVLGIPRAVEQYDVAGARGFEERRQYLGVMVEFGAVATLKLRPLRDVVPEPL